jgi:hypothetical protein
MYLKKITAIYYISFYFAQYRMYSDQKNQETNKVTVEHNSLSVKPKHIAGNFLNSLVVLVISTCSLSVKPKHIAGNFLNSPVVLVIGTCSLSVKPKHIAGNFLNSLVVLVISTCRVRLLRLLVSCMSITEMNITVFIFKICILSPLGLRRPGRPGHSLSSSYVTVRKSTKFLEQSN